VLFTLVCVCVQNADISKQLAAEKKAVEDKDQIIKVSFLFSDFHRPLFFSVIALFIVWYF